MEKYLHKCLDSLIIDQELMSLFEVLVINDGSKDSSSKIAHEYEIKYADTFRVINKENGNYGSCINRGLKESKGKYVKVLDADDSFNTENFKKYILFLCNQDCDLILNDCTQVDENGNKIGTFDNLGIKPYTKTNFEKFANKNIFPQMHCIAYKKENVTSLCYKQTEGISYTDQEWATIPMQNVQNVIYANLPLYNYLVGREGQTMSPEQLNKSFNQQKTVALSIINQTVKSDADNIHKCYLERKTASFLEHLYRGHFIHSLYDDNDFRNLDSIIMTNYPSMDILIMKYFPSIVTFPKKIILLQIIKYWRAGKTLPFYINLLLHFNKRRKMH